MQIRLKPTNEIIDSDNALQWIIDHIDPGAVEIIPDNPELIIEALKTVDEPLEVFEVGNKLIKPAEPEETAKAETPEERKERFEAILETAGARKPMPRHERRALGDRIEQKPRRLDYDL